MRVCIPSPLRSYTRQEWVEASGSTLAELPRDLDRRYPGLRFRIIDEQDAIRRHIRIFVNQELAANLAVPLGGGNDVQILCALSGW